MPRTLKKILKDPRYWLAAVLIFILATLADTFRVPQNQLTAKAYCALVRQYQHHARPLLKDKIHCRFTPTCSDYSMEAVQSQGIYRGLILTYQRITRCQNDVPMGTTDPVPANKARDGVVE